MKPTLKQVAVLEFSSTFTIQLQQAGFRIPEDGIADQSSSKNTGSKTRRFSHLLSLNSVVYFKNTKLDVDLGYVSNDRSE
jgi:iron complex outermembrane receptor protein